MSGIAGLLAACATPQHAVPGADPAVTAEARAALTRAAVDAGMARRARVMDLAFAIHRANADLCPGAAPAIGVLLADRKTLSELVGGVRAVDLAAIGTDDQLRIVHVVAGSPAAAAGLVAGDTLRAVDGVTVDDPRAATRAIARALKEKGSVRLTTIASSEDDRDATVEGTPICPFKVMLRTSPAVNGSAVHGSIVINWGAVDALDDAALGYLIAHEAAHLLARHRPAYVRNLIVSGSVITLPVLYTGAHVADMAEGMVGRHKDTPWRARALRASLPFAAGFEAEADYLGLYLFARAGGDPNAALSLMTALGRAAPATQHLRATHPPLPERMARLEAAAAEIAAKQAAGAELLPETRR